MVFLIRTLIVNTFKEKDHLPLLKVSLVSTTSDPWRQLQSTCRLPIANLQSSWVKVSLVSGDKRLTKSGNQMQVMSKVCQYLWSSCQLNCHSYLLNGDGNFRIAPESFRGCQFEHYNPETKVETYAIISSFGGGSRQHWIIDCWRLNSTIQESRPDSSSCGLGTSKKHRW